MLKRIIITLIILLLVFVVLFFNSVKKGSKSNLNISISPTLSITPHNPNEGFNLDFPAGWKLDGSRITDQNNNKTGEFNPGYVTPKNNETCEDWKQRMIEGGKDIDTEEITMSFSSAIDKTDVLENKTVTLIGREWNYIVSKQTLDGPPLSNGQSYWYVYSFCTMQGKKMFLINFYDAAYKIEKNEPYNTILSSLKFN